MKIETTYSFLPTVLGLLYVFRLQISIFFLNLEFQSAKSASSNFLILEGKNWEIFITKFFLLRNLRRVPSYLVDITFLYVQIIYLINIACIRDYFPFYLNYLLHQVISILSIVYTYLIIYKNIPTIAKSLYGRAPPPYLFFQPYIFNPPYTSTQLFFYFFFSLGSIS